MSRSISTPWGEAQGVYPCRDSGIFRATCANHGGFFVPDELLKTMEPMLRCNSYGGLGNWFEEDCEWALVALAFPHLFDSEHVWAAMRTMQAYSEPGKIYHSAWKWLNETDDGLTVQSRCANAGGVEVLV